MRFYVSPLLFIMLLVLIACGYAVEALSYLAAIVMHEFCHAALAARLGYALNQMRLMPYGAGLTGEFEGVRPTDEIKIALIGPMSNLVAAVVFVALWWGFPVTYTLTAVFVEANLFTAIINLMPVFPLDGGRALLAALGIKHDRKKAYCIMRVIGYIVALLLVAMSGILIKKVNFSLIFMAIFIFLSTVIPDKRTKYERLYSMAFRREKIEKGLPIREIMVSERAPVYKLFRMLKGEVYTFFVIVDDNLQEVARISEGELEKISISCDHNISIRAAKNL